MNENLNQHKNMKDSGQFSPDNILSQVHFKDQDAFNIFGKDKQAKPFLFGAMACLLLAACILLYLFYHVPRYADVTRSIGELRLLTQIISHESAQTLTVEKTNSVENLLESQKAFEDNLAIIANVNGDNENYRLVLEAWKGISPKISQISSNKNMILQMSGIDIGVTKVIPKIQDDYNRLSDLMIQKGLAVQNVALAKHQVFLSERILRTLNDSIDGTHLSDEQSQKFKTDIQTLSNNLKSQLETIQDPELRQILQQLQNTHFKVLDAASVQLAKNSKALINIRDSSEYIYINSDRLLHLLNDLANSSKWFSAIPAVLLVLALLGFVGCVFVLLYYRNQADKKRVLRLQREYDQNQSAILRLLNEIDDLAEGDLRSYATVSQDFTGAIADSINYAIDQLRTLVSRITHTSHEVAKYTVTTQGITNQLAEASEYQAQEIAGASTAINAMARSIDEVSATAIESADVAKKSVKIAYNGANVVHKAIEGMENIREQIQETSKRIKRLGESSQEIGNIIALINDIADQTNILALNAAIQASMAGEAGRGFAVVADEVQRLAERSALATKQIEMLVKTIQTDTSHTISSMEQTTLEVVRGANLSKDAGVALDEIQTVSNNLAKLISNISDAARLQSASASHIAGTMNVVQEITTQTTSATFDTARSVSQLANMAETLRESVADFKLPDQ